MTAPVGWPANRPGVPSHGPSPEPVGWQGIAVTVVEVASDEAPGVADASVSRETEGGGANDVTPHEDPASLEDASVGEGVTHAAGEARLDPQQSEVSEVRGYDILLGGAIVPRETSDAMSDAAVDAENTPADGGVEAAVSDGSGPGDAATTIAVVPEREGDDAYVPRHHADETEPRDMEDEAPDAAADDDIAVNPPQTAGAVTSDSGASPHAAEMREFVEGEPAEAKAVPDEALAANALPSRKARRAARPRVPAFDRVTDTDWQQPVDDEPSAYSAAPVQTPETVRTVAEFDHGDVEARGEDDAPEAAMPTTDNVDVPRPPRVSFTSVEQLPRPAHPRVLTVANQKGGVGKTTTTVNVAAGLAQAGLKVLVIDIDPQGNASTALGIEHHADVPSVYDVIVEGTPIVDVMAECPDIPGLWCAPATIDLAGAEIELVSLVARESRLHRAINAALAAASEQDRFDYVFIDCPPSLGLLTVNAFVAADEVFIPIQCEYYALEGLSQLLKNIEMIKMHLNPGLHVSTILLTMYDGRTNLSAQVADEVRTHFPDQVLGALVPRSVRISEAPSHGETVMTYDPSSTGAMSYRDAAREIALRGGAVPEPSGRIGR